MPKIEIPHRKSDRFRFKKRPSCCSPAKSLMSADFTPRRRSMIFAKLFILSQAPENSGSRAKRTRFAPGDVAVYNAAYRTRNAR